LTPQLIPIESIERRILLIRGHNVMLDRDLAKMYGVSTKVFNQAVKRNRARFPEDFMFRLSEKKASALRSQFVTLGLAQELLGILLLAPRPAGETRATSYTRGGM
jgi:hypothetical protein